MSFDARSYTDFHDLQKQYSTRFLQIFVPKMSWNKGSGVVMDVGCGPGYVTLRALLPLIPEIENIIGMDISPDMIRIAKSDNSHHKISYHVADITDACTLNQWHGKISHIVSTYCFHWLEKQRIGFRNIYSLLRDNGEAILLIVMKSPFFDAQIDIKNSPKWQKFLNNAKLVIPECHSDQLDASSYYKDMLEETGFSVLACEEYETIFTFENNDVARETIANISCFTTHIPKEKRNEFKADLLEYTIKHCGLDTHGLLTFKSQDAMLHFRKV